jgi:PAS domain S-box-containing protein
LETDIHVLLDQLPDLAWFADSEGSVRFLNRGWYAYTGARAGEADGEGWRAWHHAQHRAEILNRWAEAVARQEPLEFEAPLRGADGHYRWFLSRMRPVRRADGSVAGFIGTSTNVDELKRLAEQRTRLLASEREARFKAEDSEGRYRFLADALPHFVWTSGASGEVDYFNRRWYDYTGLGVEASMGAAWLSAIHPEDRESCMRSWDDASRTGLPYEMEVRVRRAADQQFRWHLARVLPFHDQQARLTRWLGTAVDIHEQKETRARLAAVAEGSPIGIVFLDEELRFVFVNRAAAEQVGMPEADHLGRRIDEVTPEIADVLEPALRALLAGGPPLTDFELTGETPGAPGVPRDWLVNFYPIAVGSRVAGIAGMIIDITERKRNQRALEFLATASRQLGGSLDPEQVVATVSRLSVPALADWCAVALDDDVGWRIACVRHLEGESEPSVEDLHAQLVDRLREVALRGSCERGAGIAADAELASGRLGEALGRTLETSSWMIIPLWQEQELRAVVSLGRTLSSRHFDEGDLAVAEELGRRASLALENARLYQLAQRERLRAEEASRAKDEFLAIVSHELRTPLNAIVGWTKLLRSGRVDPEKFARALETIDRNAEAQRQLIEDLLDISRIVTGKLRLEVRPVSLAALVDSSLEAIGPAAHAKGVRLQTNLPPELGDFPGDPDRLRQIIWNLLSNAVKFSAAGGRVRVGGSRGGDFVELFVEDSGQGIRRAFLPFVFDRFRQADGSTTREHGGLGLGLTIVRHLVELHGGTVWADSEGEGCGARFTVRLPLRPVLEAEVVTDSEQPPHAMNSAILEPEPALVGRRALVLDDDRDAQELVAQVLESHGMSVRLASSAEEALRALELGPPDIIVSDIGMPGQDGYEFIRRVRLGEAQQGANTPALALTAYARVEDRARAIEAGFDAHLAKPVRPAELTAQLAALLERRAALATAENRQMRSAEALAKG